MTVNILDTLFFLLSVLLILCSAVPTTTSNSLASKPVPDLVDLIKRDLRRNNDDYAEMMTKNVTKSTTTLTTTKITTKLTTTTSNKNKTLTGHQKIKLDKIDKQKKEPSNSNNLIKVAKNRRAFVDTEAENHMTNNHPLHVDNESQLIGRSHFDLPVHTEDPKDMTTKKLKAETSKTTKDMKDALPIKQDRFKSFIEANKKLFNEFIMKKQTDSELKSKENVLRTNDDAVMRARLDTLKHVPYHERQLDMAPAKGGRIHAMRLKGRLCQRNVLQPEGPKYDSRGKVYLGAYQANGGRDYARTRRPKIVLPRCCNCCKKSVLGCD